MTPRTLHRAAIADACEGWLKLLARWEREAPSEGCREMYARQARDLSEALEDFYRQEDAA